MDIVLLTNAKQTKGNIIGCVFIGNRAQPLMTMLTMMITLMLKLMTMTMQNAGVDDRPGTQPRDWILPCSTGLPKDDRSRP